MAGLMTLPLVKECVAEYARVEYGDADYFAYLNRIQHLKNDGDDTLVHQLIEFLNKWKCRLADGPPLRRALKEALSDIHAFVTATRQITIEEADLSAYQRVGERQVLQLAQIAHLCFDRLVAVGKRFSSVASAKTLHMLSPGFFVMWDRSIYEKYRCILPGAGCEAWFYAYEFLPRMQREVANLIEDGMKETGRSREEVLADIRSGFGSFSAAKTVAKVLDEFNYVMFTKGRPAKLLGSQQTTAGSKEDTAA